MEFLIGSIIIFCGFIGLGILIFYSRKYALPRHQFPKYPYAHIQWEEVVFNHYMTMLDIDTPVEELLEKYPTLKELKKENERLSKTINFYQW